MQLFILELFSTKYIKINNETIGEKIIVMLDDVHVLAAKQRKELLDNIIKLRPPVKVWVSERLEALSTVEFFSRGVIPGRDYKLTYLEEFWNTSKNKNFEKFSKSAANRRLESITEHEFNEFAGFLNSLERHRPVLFVSEFTLIRAKKDDLTYHVTMDVAAFVRRKQVTKAVDKTFKEIFDSEI